MERRGHSEGNRNKAWRRGWANNKTVGKIRQNALLKPQYWACTCARHAQKHDAPLTGCISQLWSSESRQDIPAIMREEKRQQIPQRCPTGSRAPSAKPSNPCPQPHLKRIISPSFDAIKFPTQVNYQGQWRTIPWVLPSLGGLYYTKGDQIAKVQPFKEMWMQWPHGLGYPCACLKALVAWVKVGEWEERGQERRDGGCLMALLTPPCSSLELQGIFEF